MAFRLPHWEMGRVELWHPAFPQLQIEESTDSDEALYLELFDWIEAGERVEAHNAWFERGIWQNVMMPRYGWPTVQTQQWRCSAAKAAAHALPRALDDALAALGLKIRKDPEGVKPMKESAIKRMFKPRKPRKAEREAGVTGLLWWETPESLAQLWAYCQQDVRAECALSAALPDLTEKESELYALDQEINERGFQLDRAAIHCATRLIAHETERLNAELGTITAGVVTRATQRAKLSRWFATQGFFLEDTKAATVDLYLGGASFAPMPPQVRRALEILQALGKSSTAKYQAMQNWICPDDRVHGGLLFHGASTGRWTGQGVQPHNFPKGRVKAAKGEPPITMEAVWDYLTTR